MIKRMNKVTSLLVAAAAVASIVPATAVSAADYKKTETKEGTIYSAVAYKDGKVYVDGNVKDGENDGAYYLSAGKYNDLSDIDSGATTEMFGDKYLNVDNGDYYMDLSTGKVEADDIEANSIDDVALALRKAIKNNADDRYSNHDVLHDDSNISEITVGPKFATTWYATTYTSKDTGSALNIYTDGEGKYIDADYNVGKVKVTVGQSTTAQSVTVENTDDAKDFKNNNGSAKVSIANAEIIAQDENNIYRKTTYTVENAVTPITKINGVAVTGSAFTVETSGTGNKVSFTAIQKISKSQASDTVDGAKYSAAVTNYVLADENGAKIDLLEDAKFSAFGTKLVSYVVADEKVTAQTIDFKTTSGFNYIDPQDESTDEVATAFDVDANGNLWRLESGYIYKFDNNEDWVKTYKVDGAMDALNVYDENNLVAWSTDNGDDDQVYTIVSGKDTTDTTTDTTNTDTTTDTTTTVKAGWNKNADGTWSFINNDKSKATGWVKDGATWYFLNNSGIMQTGWVKDGATWYYLNNSGAMQTGWVKDGSVWYYLNNSGAMQTGWFKDTDGNWYFLQDNGAMAANTTVGGYKLGANGAWIR